MKLSFVLSAFSTLLISVLTVGCAVTPDDSIEYVDVMYAESDNAVIRFPFTQYASMGTDDIDWVQPELYGPAPAPQPDTTYKPFPVLYRTSIDLSIAQNAQINKLIFDQIHAEDVTALVNGSLVQANFIDTARRVYDINSYLHSGKNEIIVLCIPYGEIDRGPEAVPPMLLKNGRLTLGNDADTLLTVWDYAADLPGITQKWFDPEQTVQNDWTPSNYITRVLEFYHPAPIRYTPKWLTFDLETSRPINVRVPRDLVIDPTNWGTVTNWYKLDFELPRSTGKKWKCTVQYAGEGYIWVNGNRLEGLEGDKQQLTFMLDPAFLKAGPNAIVMCITPAGNIPSLIAAEISPAE